MTSDPHLDRPIRAGDAHWTRLRDYLAENAREIMTSSGSIPEDRLRQHEEAFRSVLSNAKDGFWDSHEIKDMASYDAFSLAFAVDNLPIDLRFILTKLDLGIDAVYEHHATKDADKLTEGLRSARKQLRLVNKSIQDIGERLVLWGIIDGLMTISKDSKVEEV